MNPKNFPKLSFPSFEKIENKTTKISISGMNGMSKRYINKVNAASFLLIVILGLSSLAVFP
jgi:hypothetical protein